MARKQLEKDTDENEEVSTDGIQIYDRNGVLYTPENILDIVDTYKTNTYNFVIGTINHKCNKLGRSNMDDWYEWTKDLMKDTDSREKVIKELTEDYGHKMLEEYCMKIGKEKWGCSLEERLKKYLDQKNRFVSKMLGDHGILVSYGRLKYKKAKDVLFSESPDNTRQKFGDEKHGKGSYIRYRKYKWKMHYEEIKEREDSIRYYRTFY